VKEVRPRSPVETVVHGAPVRHYETLETNDVRTR
jgi:hypothetical protein